MTPAGLESWLDSRPEGTRGREAAWLAHRAAMRVLPICWMAIWPDDISDAQLNAIPILRAALISGILEASRNPNIDEIVVVAGAMLTSSQIAARTALEADPNRSLAASRAILAIESSLNANAVASTALSNDAAIAFDQGALNDSDLSLNLDVDLAWLEGERGGTDRPLWATEKPDSGRSELEFAAHNRLDGPWDFWIDWYQRALDGRPQDLPLLEKIAFQKEDFWDGTDGEVNQRIAQIVEEHRSDGPITSLSQRIEQAIELTPNGERIEVNPETGKLLAISESALPSDTAEYAARKIERALAVFAGETSNQYSALAPELELLRAALDVDPIHPVELFDACASAANRVRMRCESGSLPEPDQDPLIADFLTQIRNAGADIFAHDHRTQQMVAARNEVLGNDALIDAREEVVTAVAEIVPITEGILADDLKGDAEVATDSEADPQERKNRGYRLVSRTVKIAGVVVVGGSGVIASVAAIADSPAVNALIQAALRYLGL